MKIPFKTNKNDGDESVMIVGDINPDEIRFNRVTRVISLVCYNTLDLEDLDGMSWQQIKKLVIKHGGTWDGKKNGINFLIGKEK